MNFFLLSQAIVTLRSRWQRAGTAKAGTMTLTGSRPIPERSLHQIHGCPQVRTATLENDETIGIQPRGVKNTLRLFSDGFNKRRGESDIHFKNIYHLKLSIPQIINIAKV